MVQVTTTPGTIPRMIKIIRIRKRRLLKKLFLFFTFSTPFSFNMQFPACALFVRKTLFCLSNPYHLITEKIVFHLFFLKMGTKRTVGVVNPNLNRRHISLSFSQLLADFCRNIIPALFFLRQINFIFYSSIFFYHLNHICPTVIITIGK